MKSAIIGYVTGLVNINERTLDYCEENNDDIVVDYFKDYINELNDLLDFIEDIPEEGQANSSLSDAKLQEYVEGIETDNKLLRAEIVQKKLATIVWEESCIALKKRNEELEKEIVILDDTIKELNGIVVKRFNTIYDLENEIKLLKRGITK